MSFSCSIVLVLKSGFNISVTLTIWSDRFQTLKYFRIRIYVVVFITTRKMQTCPLHTVKYSTKSQIQPLFLFRHQADQHSQ